MLAKPVARKIFTPNDLLSPRYLGGAPTNVPFAQMPDLSCLPLAKNIVPVPVYCPSRNAPAYMAPPANV